LRGLGGGVGDESPPGALQYADPCRSEGLGCDGPCLTWRAGLLGIDSPPQLDPDPDHAAVPWPLLDDPSPPTPGAARVAERLPRVGSSSPMSLDRVHHTATVDLNPQPTEHPDPPYDEWDISNYSFWVGDARHPPAPVLQDVHVPHSLRALPGLLDRTTPRRSPSTISPATPCASRPSFAPRTSPQHTAAAKQSKVRAAKQPKVKELKGPPLSDSARKMLDRKMGL
jgi:hypothetical protein